MTTKREPSGESVLSARIMRAYPTLSSYSAASLAAELCAIERAQRRHAERCCCGADGGYVRRKEGAPVGLGAYTRHVLEHDPDAERKAGERIEKRVDIWNERLARLATECIPCRSAAWLATELCAIDLQGDPRGPVLLVRLPGEHEAVAV